MRRSVRTVLIVVPGALAIAAVIVLAVMFMGNADGSPSPSASVTPSRTVAPTPVPTPTRSATPSPVPTATADPAPEPAPTDQVQPEPSPAGPVTVTIVSWGADGQSVYASGIVTGDAGEGGTCTLMATSPTGQVLTGQRDAQSTPAAANCGVIQIAAPPGDWTLVLTYQSEIASGSSDPTQVTQP